MAKRLTVAEFAGRVKRSERTVHEWLARGEAPGVAAFIAEKEERAAGGTHGSRREVATLDSSLARPVLAALKASSASLVEILDEVPAGRIHEAAAIERFPWLSQAMARSWRSRKGCTHLDGKRLECERYRVRRGGRVWLDPFYFVAQLDAIAVARLDKGGSWSNSAGKEYRTIARLAEETGISAGLIAAWLRGDTPCRGLEPGEQFDKVRRVVRSPFRGTWQRKQQVLLSVAQFDRIVARLVEEPETCVGLPEGRFLTIAGIERLGHERGTFKHRWQHARRILGRRPEAKVVPMFCRAAHGSVRVVPQRVYPAADVDALMSAKWRRAWPVGKWELASPIAPPGDSRSTKRGRKKGNVKTDVKRDAKLFEDWISSGQRTYAEFAQARGWHSAAELEDLKAAIKREYVRRGARK